MITRCIRPIPRLLINISRGLYTCTAIIILSTSVVSAASYTWDGGGGDSNWTTTANWDADPTPFDNTDDLIFTGSTRTTPNVDGTQTINSVTFDSSASSFTIGGSQITFSGTSPNITQSDNSAQEISTDISLGSNVTVAGNGSGTLTLSGILSGANNLTKTGTSTLNLTGASTYTGTTSILEGTLIAFDDVVLNNDSALGNSASMVYLGDTSGSADATLEIAFKTGGLNYQLFERDITVQSGNTGTAVIKTSGMTGDGFTQIVILKGDIAVNNSLDFQIDNRDNTQLEGSLSGSGDISISVDGGTSGNFIIKNSSDNSSYSGDITVANGTLDIRDNNAMGTGGTTTMNGGIIYYNGTNGAVATDEAIVLNGGELWQNNADNSNSGGITLSTDTQFRIFGNTFTESGVVSGTGNLTKSDNGTLILSGTSANTASGSLILNTGTIQLNKTAGTDAWAGDITVGDGSGTDTLRLDAANQIADTSAVTLNSSGVFNLNGNNETIGSLAAASSSASVTLGAGRLTSGGDNSSTSFAGAISGTGGLTKEGSGTMTLSGSNTYTGETIINDGTLLLDATNVISNSSSLTMTGGTLNANGNSDTMATLTLNGDSIIDFGSGDFDLTFSDLAYTSGTVKIYNWTGTYSYSGTAGTAASDTRLLFSGLGGNSEDDYFSNIWFYSDSGTTKLGTSARLIAANGVGYELVAVPETSTLLSLAGLLGVACLIHKRRKALASSITCE